MTQNLLLIHNKDIKSLNNITKYWTYGCWCFQMGDFPLRLGNGSPVDGVDKWVNLQSTVSIVQADNNSDILDIVKNKKNATDVLRKIIWSNLERLASPMRPNTSSRLNMIKSLVLHTSIAVSSIPWISFKPNSFH